jgi:hypothetical protein
MMNRLRPSQSFPAMAAERGTPFSEPLLRYQYEPLPSNRSIRLLRLIGFSIEERTIFGAMRHVDLGEALDPYLALSYTWGDAVDEQYYPAPSPAHHTRLPKSPCTLIILRQPRVECSDDVKTIPRFGEKMASGPGTGTLPLTQNLSDFLQMSAGDITRNRYEIWIDALCIDQENRDELASQVLLMGDIYGFAEQVCVWLGAADGENGESRDVGNLKWLVDHALPKLAAAYHERGRAFLDLCTAIKPTDGRFWARELALSPPDGATWVELWVSYFRFFASRKWFSRAWVVQEAVLARVAAVIIGQVVVSWETLFHLDRLVHLPRWSQTLSLHEPRFPRTLQTQLMGYMVEYTELRRAVPASPQLFHGRAIPSWHATLARALMAARLKNATVAKDKILCILGLVQRGVAADEFQFILSRLGSTQASEQTLFTSCSRLLVEYGGLHMLSLVQNAYLPGIAALPSWVIDWSVSTAWWPLSRETTFRSTPLMQEGEIFARFLDSRLLVGGMRIDVVTGAHTIYHNVDRRIGEAQRFNATDAAFHPLPGAVLDVLSAIGPSYSRDGTSAEDVLWHTLILGSYGTAAPPGEAHENRNSSSTSSEPTTPCYTPTPKRGCLEYLAFQFAASGLPDMAARIAAAISHLERAAAATVPPQPSSQEGNIPNSGLVMALKKALEMRERARAAGGGHFHPSHAAAAFATQMIMRLKYRKLFSTAGRLAGACPLSAQPQDEVWLLRGLPYPVILRRQPGGPREKQGWVFVGDAYVFGIMFGEADETENPDMYKAIEIV